MLARLVVWPFLVGTMIFGASVVFGQNYPVKPIRIVTSQAGSGVDFASRLVAQALSPSLGQPVYVDNRNTLIATEFVAKAPPDGYTLLVTASSFIVGPLLRDTPYDPVRDFSPITLATTSPSVLVTHPSLPVKSVKELLALAKARPGAINYAAGTVGSSAHLAAELFKAMAGVNIMQIAYKGTATAINDLIGGQVQIMFSIAGPVLPHVKSGRLRALATTNPKASELFPGLPTVAATGLPGYEWIQVSGVVAPAKTPENVINRLNQEIVRVLNRSDVKEKLFNTGVEVVGSSPEEFAVAIKTEMAKMSKVIKNAGIRAE